MAWQRTVERNEARALKSLTVLRLGKKSRVWHNQCYIAWTFLLLLSSRLHFFKANLRSLSCCLQRWISSNFSVLLATSCEKNWNRWRWWWFCGGFLFPLYFTSSSFSSQMKETRRNDEMSRVFFEIWFVIRTISHFSWLKPSLSAAVASLRFLSDQIRIRTLRRP